ncbi:MAG: hypothetical protein FWG72_04510 [Oscillospiraceae bacterium]|nr:hypothetical protein [Oscillospiraceae bacterium]
MFLFDSAEMAEPEQYYSDLADLLPPAADLAKAGYIVVVQAYFASDETSDDLAQRRAGAVSGMIRELGIPDASIRPHAATASGGAERYRQRADVYFLHVDSK